jgi:hypothetical protein
MDADGSLLIVEQVHSPVQPASIVEYLNLSSVELMVGRERTIAQYAQLLGVAGFRVTAVTSAPNSPFHVLVARIAAADQT